MFSVLVPSYNHAPYLADAVASALRSPLAGELLIVDDGSRDGSQAVIARLAAGDRRIRVLPGSGESNRGAARRLDELAAAARYPWLAVLNSDDAFVAGRFELLHPLFAAGIEFASGLLLIMDHDGRRIGTKRGVDEPEFPFPADLAVKAHLARGELTPCLANQNFAATTSNMVFTRSLWERVGGFRDYRYTHDWDFALRASLSARCRFLPHFLTIYRAHGTNTIRESVDATRDEVRRLFRELLHDVPRLRSEPAVCAALRGNRYLGPEWLAEQGIARRAAPASGDEADRASAL